MANASNVHGFVGLQARSAPSLCYLRDLVAQDYLGELVSTTIVADGGRPWGGETYASGTYMNHAENGATMLSIPFGHSIDFLSTLFGSPRDVVGRLAVRWPDVRVADTGDLIRADSPDQVAMLGTLPGGAVVSVHFRGGFSCGEGFRWELNGTERDLVVTGTSGHLQYGQVRLHGGERKDRTMQPLPVPESYQKLALDPDGHANAVGHSYLNVLADMRDGGHRAPTFEDALPTHVLIDEIERSAAR